MYSGWLTINQPTMEKISGKYTIKQIFQDNWEEYLTKHPDVPDYVRENVTKMLNCRNPEKIGYTKYACPSHPHRFTVVPHSCKSRFCNSCGKVAVDNWIVKSCETFPNVPYLHITFTIPEELRQVFLDYPEMRKLLFKVSSEIILKWCKERGWKPAITAVLHTFGRDLKFHPHIHMLVSAGGVDLKSESKWLECNYVPEAMVKERWKARLLHQLIYRKLITRRIRRNLYFYKWYVKIVEQLLIAEITTNYVGRYTKRPPLAEARIMSYDGISVIFAYEDWYLGKTVNYLTVTVEEFITRLITHIPPKHFRLINHYGALHNRKKKKYLILLKKLFGSIRFQRMKLSWRKRQKAFKKNDPLICPECRKEMIPVQIVFWSRIHNSLWAKYLG